MFGRATHQPRPDGQSPTLRQQAADAIRMTELKARRTRKEMELATINDEIHRLEQANHTPRPGYYFLDGRSRNGKTIVNAG